MCANLVDPVPTGVACSRSLVVARVAGMLARHGPPPAARGCGAAPTTALSLSARHGPLRAVHGRGLVAAATPGLLAGHGPLRVVRGLSRVVATGLRWTCDPDSSVGGQWQIACS